LFDANFYFFKEKERASSDTASPKFLGLGYQQYFVWDTASQSTK